MTETEVPRTDTMAIHTMHAVGHYLICTINTGLQ